jgi:choline dehydrogenase
MYEYVIVGAGSAGCVLAHRLTEDPTCSVLLLESGGADMAREFHIPAAFSTLYQSASDWSYYTEEQEQLQQRNVYIPRGKVLGGSSSINTMIYMRGNRSDYDHWCALGNQGWSYAEVLPYFKKAEHQERGSSPYHGVGGPLSVADLRCVNPLTRAFVAAGVELGWAHTADFNGAEQEGVGVYQVTQKRGQRHSAADAYLKPARRRRNLTVLSHAHATRLLFEQRRCVGVAYRQDGHPQQTQVRREVLLCAGAINSPQLLLLSGIGPAAHLHQLGIPITQDLPGVGQNLQDHLAAGVIYACTQPVSLARRSLDTRNAPIFAHWGLALVSSNTALWHGHSAARGSRLCLGTLHRSFTVLRAGTSGAPRSHCWCFLRSSVRREHDTGTHDSDSCHPYAAPRVWDGRLEP